MMSESTFFGDSATDKQSSCARTLRVTAHLSTRKGSSLMHSPILLSLLDNQLHLNQRTYAASSIIPAIDVLPDRIIDETGGNTKRFYRYP